MVSDLVDPQEVLNGLPTPLLLISDIGKEHTSEKNLGEENVGGLSFGDGGCEEEDVGGHCDGEEEELFPDKTEVQQSRTIGTRTLCARDMNTTLKRKNTTGL